MTKIGMENNETFQLNWTVKKYSRSVVYHPKVLVKKMELEYNGIMAV